MVVQAGTDTLGRRANGLLLNEKMAGNRSGEAADLRLSSEMLEPALQQKKCRIDTEKRQQGKELHQELHQE